MAMSAGWAGVALGAALVLAGCVRREAESGPGDSVSVRQQAQATPEAADTVRVAPPRALDTRPWVPVVRDTLTVEKAESPAAPAPSRAPAQAGEWTAGVTERKREGLRPVVVRAIRTGGHAGWDRVVFDFEGEKLPGYRVEYVDGPVRKCGSGDVTEVAGEGWLQVRLLPARAHTERGEATVRDRERKLSLPVLRELELTCDFEGQVEAVLGVSAPNRYRVLELSDPARLVVDVRR